MNERVITYAEGVALICTKIIEQFSSGGLKTACAKVLDRTGPEEARILLALKGVRSAADLDEPAIRRYIRSVAESTNVPFDELMENVRQVVIT